MADLLRPLPCANCIWASPRHSEVPYTLAYPFPTASSSTLPDFPVEGNSPIISLPSRFVQPQPHKGRHVLSIPLAAVISESIVGPGT